jgi:thiosulfate/3-mercaptopyruvate sulfurtransferase
MATNRRVNRLISAFACAAAMAATLSFNVQAGPPANTGVLIDAATLQNWMAKGQFNGAASCGKVVLLDVTDPDSYVAGHIPGAQLWDVAAQVQTRVEGPAPAVNMVLDGAHMDAMLQRHGIDKNTTVIITSSKADTYFPARAYFLFRYWGWPKNRIKVLDGFNGAWEGELTETPTVCPWTDYSVKDRKQVLTDQRASLSEAIQMVLYGTGMMVDMRGDKSAAGSTPGVFNPDDPNYPSPSGDYVVFEGTPVGGRNFLWKDFNINYSSGDLRFKSPEEIEQALMDKGIDGSTPILSYCRTGYIASVGYLVLDAILGWDVMTYDGSWSQWGKMSYYTDKGGELPNGSSWAVDTQNYMDVVNYNADADADADYTVESLFLDQDAYDACPSPFETCANNVEAEDAAYVSQR